MAALAEFERDLLRERVRSGIAAARQRGVVFGRRFGRFPLNHIGPNVGQCNGKHHRLAWALSKAECNIEFAGII